MARSSFIANIVAVQAIDKQLIEFSKTHNLTYSRFVDDLVFSSQQDFADKTHFICKIVNSEGFKINHRKTSYKIGPVTVTGILVKHNRITLTDDFKNRDLSGYSENSVRGIINYANRVKHA